MKIIEFRAEHVKRIKAVYFTPKADGVTLIGGANAQGKTSILDAILSLVMGKKSDPTNPVHNGADKGEATITLDNGVTVSLVYKQDGRGALKVSGVTGSPQAALNSLFGKNALDVSRILRASDKERRDIILETLGATDELDKVDAAIKAAYEDRAAARVVAERAKTVYDHGRQSLPTVSPGDPDQLRADLVELRTESDELQAKQLEIAKINSRRETLRSGIEATKTRIEELEAMILKERGLLEEQTQELRTLSGKLFGTGDLEERRGHILDQIELVQQQLEVAAQHERLRDLQNSAALAHKEFLQAETTLEDLRKHRVEVIARMAFPLEGMGLDEDLNLTYNGQPWDGISGAERYMVAAAMQARITPDCPILLVDGLESMDRANLIQLNDWAASQGIQIIGTVVSETPNNCDVFILDGSNVDPSQDQSADVA